MFAYINSGNLPSTYQYQMILPLPGWDELTTSPKLTVVLNILKEVTDSKGLNKRLLRPKFRFLDPKISRNPPVENHCLSSKEIFNIICYMLDLKKSFIKMKKKRKNRKLIFHCFVTTFCRECVTFVICLFVCLFDKCSASSLPLATRHSLQSEM